MQSATSPARLQLEPSEIKNVNVNAALTSKPNADAYQGGQPRQQLGRTHTSHVQCID